MLRWMSDNILKDRKRIECICKKLELEVTPIDDKMR